LLHDVVWCSVVKWLPVHVKNRVPVYLHPKQVPADPGVKNACL
jgi:hypothetical protein